MPSFCELIPEWGAAEWSLVVAILAALGIDGGGGWKVACWVFRLAEKNRCRYVAELSFRYSNGTAIDFENTTRTVFTIKGLEGKRLIHRQPTTWTRA